MILVTKECVFTVNHVSKLGYKLFLLAALSSWHQALEGRWVWIPVHIHKEGWRHEMRRLLRLLVQHVVVRVTDKRSVVGVEKHLVRNLEGIKSTSVKKMR